MKKILKERKGRWGDTLSLADKTKMQDSTRIIRSTLTRPVAGEPLHPGPVFAAPYHAPGDPAENPYTYARSHNPTWTALEKAIGQMESGPGYRATALVFGSGMAACTAVFGAVLRPGNVVVLPSNAYYAARVLLQEYFANMGVVLRMAPTAGNAQAELLEGAKLHWLESPSNPTATGVETDLPFLSRLTVLSEPVPLTALLGRFTPWAWEVTTEAEALIPGRTLELVWSRVRVAS